MAGIEVGRMRLCAGHVGFSLPGGGGSIDPPKTGGGFGKRAQLTGTTKWAPPPADSNPSWRHANPPPPKKNLSGGRDQGCIGRGGPPPPLQGAQPVPGHCLPDDKCQLHWHL